MLETPSAYTNGYAKARLEDQALADNYIKHTTMGDAVLDPVMEELSSLPPGDLHRFIEGGIEQRDEILAQAPQVLRDFFGDLEDPPWLDFEAFRPGIRAFHANVDLVLVAFVTGVLVEGFSTLIAKSFKITGRVASTKRFCATGTSKILPGLTSKRFVPVFAPSTQTSISCLSPSLRVCSWKAFRPLSPSLSNYRASGLDKKTPAAE